MAKRFHFRLESVLQLRIQERETAEAEVAAANQAIKILEDQGQQIEAERAQIRAGSSQDRSQEKIAIDVLLNQGRYDVHLANQLNETIENRKKVLVERDRRLVRLQEANAEVRKLEILKEKQKRQWVQNQLAVEQAALDDLASIRFIQQTRQRADSQEP